MHAFPLAALFLFNGIFVLGSTLVMVWLFRRRPDTSANFWIGAGAFSTVATTLTAFKPDLPQFSGHLLPNTLQVTHHFFLAFSFLALCGLKIQRGWVVASFGLVFLFGAGLQWVSDNSPTVWQVPYVSFVNGLLALVISDLIKRQREKNPALHHLICPQKVLLTLGVLWLLRIPMSAAGMNLHAEAPGLVNWLLFASLLTMNIVLQFSYFAVRLAGSIENRGQLVEINRRLHALLNEHDGLVPKINSGFAALPAQMLSAQIAHELNQPLASLRLKLETLLSFPVARLDDAPMKSMVADIERISGIVRSLQHLVRGEDLDIRRHDLGTIFNSALGSLPGVEMVSPTGPLPVMMDAPLIASALKSLVHCLQAFAESSSNESGANFDVIATCDTAQDGLWAQIWLSAPGAHLDPNIITVLQSGKVLDPIGHAMPSHSIHQLINLLMVQYVMRAQRGQISVETRHGGSGTMMMLRIPIAALTSGRLPVVA